MNFFTKKETLGVGIILIILIAVSIPNFLISLARARDAQRKNDLGAIYDAIASFQRAISTFPLSTKDGKIIGCVGPDTKYDEKLKMWLNLRVCEWGVDGLTNLVNPSSTPFIQALPNDPRYKEGFSYHYYSNGRRFQIYAALERKDQDEYSLAIAKLGLKCGSQICNIGKAYGDTPLDMSIEEYENKLLEEEKLKK
jgi:type II secretory pathway pseudopilin PulG